MIEYSAIIPVFNRAAVLPRAIASVLAQTRPPGEIIVVDDASTDGTSDVAARLGVAMLRVVRHAQNRGPAAARNTGVESARMPWIAFLDSDDEWAPSKAQRQIALLEKGAGSARGWVTGYAIHDGRNGRTTRFRPEPGILAPEALLFGCPFSTGSTLMVERDAFVDTGGFDASLRRLEDWDWVMRYQRRHRLVGLPDELAVIHKSSDPSYVNVATAVARLREVHGPIWRHSSPGASRKFESSLDIEEAAGAYFERSNRKAVMLTLRAVAAYPLRGRAFYAMLARRLIRTLWR